MSSIPATFSDPVHELRYRIADLLAHIETENDGLDARTATLALLETAYGAALTFCASPDRARRHVGAAVDQYPRRHRRPSDGPERRRFDDSPESGQGPARLASARRAPGRTPVPGDHGRRPLLGDDRLPGPPRPGLAVEPARAAVLHRARARDRVPLPGLGRLHAPVGLVLARAAAAGFCSPPSRNGRPRRPSHCRAFR